MPSLFRLLRLLFVGALAAIGTAGAQAQTAPAFDFDSVARLAAERAHAAYVPASTTLPAELQGLDYDGLRDIRFRPARALWRDANLPFEAMFFHRGLYQREAVQVNEVTPAGVKPLHYDSRDYDFGANAVHPDTWGDLGHAGFRIHYPLNSPAYKDELVVFLGASYFRALGAGQQYGLSARGLAIDTVGGEGEEFPRFTAFWLQKPAADARQLTLYALLESPRATGAYRFDITPGTDTVMRVQARVFLRVGAARPVATLGIAPLTSMFLSGENQPRPGDFRPEVHDSDGLMIASGDGEWLWRPLQNPARTSTNSFAVQQLRGFGLMQRDRQFASYEDVEARYERRPSAWVRPLGDWGPGRVELLQLHAPDETHDNVVAYWVPAQLPAPGKPLDFAYELLWQGDTQQRPPGAWTQQSRRGSGYAKDAAARAGEVQYAVDFAGPALDALPADAPVRAVVSAGANGRVVEQNTYPLPDHRGWRLVLRVARADAAQPVELRAFLQHDGHVLSETWSNIVLPE
ncbi:glucan biosynthesis protein G [Ramlibacter sp. G-1-2-2]|uniref:Glucans biosynthesis protein G n=1 Tax=Ramlibacter agri TaxID=2728837 RepID=A0A848H063_9BURK|nr:glucan biosynthesis protein G [Ramlibacter agri]NML43021.1 glucan biosynthesis protein G [Ramlibacter agri]